LGTSALCGSCCCSVANWVASADARLRLRDGPAQEAVDVKAMAATRINLRTPFIGRSRYAGRIEKSHHLLAPRWRLCIPAKHAPQYSRYKSVMIANMIELRCLIRAANAGLCSFPAFFAEMKKMVWQ